MNKETREPQAFVLDNPVEADEKSKPVKVKVNRTTTVEFAPEHADQALVPVLQTKDSTVPIRFRWLTLLLGALLTLITMWAGLAITEMIESFFARSPWLGWLSLAIAGLAGLAALVLVAKEIIGLLRLKRIEDLQQNAARAINLDDKQAMQKAVAEIRTLYATRADTKWGLKKFDSHASDILDPKDRMKLADTLIVEPLDELAQKIIARRARRVTLLTTVTPAAVLDILFVAAQNLGMLREIATLYGGKPSAFSTLKLARMVMTHLAVTGGLALSDSLLQQVLGKGLLGRLSARFGEGAVNGILTARIGLAASNVCRPIPKEASQRETLASLLREVLNFSDSGKTSDHAKS